MKQYTIQAPDGKTITLEGPDGASQEEVIAQAQKLYQPKAQPLAPEVLQQRQAASKAAFEQNQPSLLGGFASEAKKNALKVGGIMLDTAPEAATGMDSPAVALMSAAAPSGAQWEGLRNLPSMIKKSPAGSLISSAAEKLGITRPPTPFAQQVEQKLGATGGQGKRMSMDVAPELAKNPQLVKAKPGEEFDAALHREFQKAGNTQRSIEGQIPDGTEVAKHPIIDGFNELIERYEGIGAEDAVRALTKQRDTIAKMGGESLTWGQFSPTKSRFGNDLRSAGVWKRIAADTATEKDFALAQAYGKFMDASNGVSPILTKANKQFSTFHDAMIAAGLDFDTGRRIANVGKEAADTLLMKAGKTALKAGALGATGAAGYNAYRSITGP